MRVELKPLSVTVVGEACEYRLMLRAGESCSSVAIASYIAVWEEELVVTDRNPLPLELWHFDLTAGHRLLARHLYEFKQDQLFLMESLVEGQQFWLRMCWQLKRSQAEEWLQFFSERRAAFRKL